MDDLQIRSHPGEQFFQVLEELAGHITWYRKWGFEGVFPQAADDTVRLSEIETLETLEDVLQGCQRCALCAGRRHLVFGVGNPDAELIVIGSAPDESEERQQEPFVGDAGELFTKILQAIHVRREDVYLMNLVKCRPPQNRPPASDEILRCEPFLRRQIELIQPKIICVLGEVAAQALLKTATPLSDIRGKFYEYQGIKVIPTYHPEHLLHHASDKRLVWYDMQMIQRELSQGT